MHSFFRLSVVRSFHGTTRESTQGRPTTAYDGPTLNNPIHLFKILRTYIRRKRTGGRHAFTYACTTHRTEMVMAFSSASKAGMTPSLSASNHGLATRVRSDSRVVFRRFPLLKHLLCRFRKREQGGRAREGKAEHVPKTSLRLALSQSPEGGANYVQNLAPSVVEPMPGKAGLNT